MSDGHPCGGEGKDMDGQQDTTGSPSWASYLPSGPYCEVTEFLIRLGLFCTVILEKTIKLFFLFLVIQR